VTMFDRLYPFRGLEWRRYFHQYTTPRDWKRGARDIPFGLGAKTLYVDGTNGNDHNDGLSWKTAFKTIQHAIDEADSWTNIFIKDGTYSEALSIPSGKSSLSLIGESWKGVIISAEDTALDVISDSNSFMNLYLKAIGEHYACLATGGRNIFKNCFFETSGSSTHAFALSGDDNLVSHSETSDSVAFGVHLFGCRNEFAHCRLFGSNTVLRIEEDSDDGLFHDCSFFNASAYAVYAGGGSNNLFYHNNFINNTNAIYDNGYNKFLENFYDDHSNIDNGFGIATSPYSFTGGSDPRPVVCRNGWLALSWADADLVAAIKAVTDNLPDNGSLNDLAAIRAVTDNLPDNGSLNDLAAIRAVTDNLPDNGSLNDLASILANQKKYWHWHALHSDDYHVIAGTWSVVDYSGQHLGCVLSNYSAAALNDEISVPFFAPSTSALTLNIRCVTNSVSGIITVYVDGQSQGTLDLYSASEQYNVIKTISITPARAGINILRLRVTDHNASSSDYWCLISEMWLS